ncbi:Ppx/GppA family phosphatase [Thalassobius sp. I31.1]|uniref:Ppx/GppA family phosphatase n=1 Tax=Thalassobius sp. I31.1 TaxID=2109912 RepID=UPI001E2CA85A|nr:Ppx/GppA family phosphatase [Thalassobius sp. I31.1]
MTRKKMTTRGDSDLHDDWGLFGRPLFEDPAVRSLSRVGVVDVGSNSVRLVVFDGAARSPAYFFNEKIMCALGADLPQTGKLSVTGRARALSAIRRFQELARGMGLEQLTAVATAAVREASDGLDFCAEVLRETGLNIHVIDGLEEARLSAQGVLLGWPTARGLVCDIGGSSMELAEVSEGEVGRAITSALGPQNLKAVRGGKKGLKAHIKDGVEELRDAMPGDYERLYLVGGSWRAIARLDMERRGYPLTVLHEYRMTPKSVMDTVKWIEENDLEELRARTGTSEARMILVPEASRVLKQLVRTFKPVDIAVSSYGIREGMLYEQMPDRLRKRDPLIEACRFAEVKDARMPGFGKALYEFVSPLFKSANADRQRLIKAACLLHDVTWRAHPDFRAEVCFDNATRANLGGLRHRERVFLGLSLLHRYKNSRDGTRFEELFDMLTEKEIRDAEILGKAMRFGAMFSVNKPNDVAALKLFPQKKQLELALTKEGDALLGEVAEARFKSLAKSLDADARLKRKKSVRAEA